ncbi:MAG: HNH endonuclease [Planctomycetota bacterium]|nr:MAG: HNH endonuclease [Planctomycetota bacterium]
MGNAAFETTRLIRGGRSHASTRMINDALCYAFAGEEQVTLSHLHEGNLDDIASYALSVISKLVEMHILPAKHLNKSDDPIKWLAHRGLKEDVLRSTIAAKLGIDLPMNVGRSSNRISVPSRNAGARRKSEVLSAYGNRCLISGCTVRRVLIGAHIIPHERHGTDGPENVIPLRADIDKLFESISGRPLMSIHPDDFTVHISPQLAGTDYEQSAGRLLNFATGIKPERENLVYHFDLFLKGIPTP